MNYIDRLALSVIRREWRRAIALSRSRAKNPLIADATRRAAAAAGEKLPAVPIALSHGALIRSPNPLIADAERRAAEAVAARRGR